jgi:hypothetical protein
VLTLAALQLDLKVASRVAVVAGTSPRNKADTRDMPLKAPVALKLVERMTTHRLELTLGDKALLVINKRRMADKTLMLRECLRYPFHGTSAYGT